MSSRRKGMKSSLGNRTVDKIMTSDPGSEQWGDDHVADFSKAVRTEIREVFQCRICHARFARVRVFYFEGEYSGCSSFEEELTAKTATHFLAYHRCHENTGGNLDETTPIYGIGDRQWAQIVSNEEEVMALYKDGWAGEKDE